MVCEEEGAIDGAKTTRDKNSYCAGNRHADGLLPIGCKVDNEDAVACYRYFAGLADKIHGTTIELDDQEKYATTRKEPIGVVAQIGKSCGIVGIVVND